jgi:hypothetical protein
VAITTSKLLSRHVSLAFYLPWPIDGEWTYLELVRTAIKDIGISEVRVDKYGQKFELVCAVHIFEGDVNCWRAALRISWVALQVALAAHRSRTYRNMPPCSRRLSRRTSKIAYKHQLGLDACSIKPTDFLAANERHRMSTKRTFASADLPGHTAVRRQTFTALRENFAIRMQAQ